MVKEEHISDGKGGDREWDSCLMKKCLRWKDPDTHMRGWMFTNFVAMILYCNIYNILVGKETLSSCSPAVIVMHLSRIYNLTVGDRWMLS